MCKGKSLIVPELEERRYNYIKKLVLMLAKFLSITCCI